MIRSFDLAQAPGHLIRRAQQIAVAEFTHEMSDFDITPVQFALLNALLDSAGADQITLAKSVAFDPATSGSVIARLEAKGWVRREPDEQDRRRKLLYVTDEGMQALEAMKEAVGRAQQRILQPLSNPEQKQLVQLLSKLVAGHEEP
jgi:DNA-binding MarR family transcriptional regulator